jgi:transporter family protein
VSVDWLLPALLAVALWGIVGILQKLASNRINADSQLIWVTAGYVIALPLMMWEGGLDAVPTRYLLIGVLAGAVNGLGSWFLFASLERGAKASVAVPLTALYPLVTLVLAFLFLEERLTAREWVGVVLALCGAMMLSYERG